MYCKHLKLFTANLDTYFSLHPKVSLEQEERARVSPEQEQQQLLADVKMHNGDIAALDRQTKELEESINRLQEELHDAESALEDQQVRVLCLDTPPTVIFHGFRDFRGFHH